MKMDVQVVIPGHVPCSWSGRMTPAGVLEHSLSYIEAYETALESSQTSDEVIAKMLERYPQLEHRSALYLGTFMNFQDTHRLLFNPRAEKVASFLPKPLVQWIDKKLYQSKRETWNL